MSILVAILLGLIQGLTEFLPISSSAHVAFYEQVFNLGQLAKPQLTAFIATIQLGTEAAVIIFFIKDICHYVSSWFGGLRKPEARNHDYKMGWLIIIGSLPLVLVGLIVKSAIETTLRSLWVAAVCLIVFGLLLGVADRLGSRRKQITELSVRDGVLFGIGQALAVIPGVSRSGGLISAGLFLGYSREAAARFSFLLAIPAVLASGIFEFASTVGDLPSSMLLATAIGTAVSFAVGYAVIGLLLRYLTKGSFLPFVIYRVGFGLVIIGLLGTGVISA